MPFVDLVKDRETILKYVKQRMAEYPFYENYGPGNDEDPVKSITIGFDIGDCSWVSLVFDTHKTNNRDWISYVDCDLNLIEFPQWNEAAAQLDAEQIVYQKGSLDTGAYPCLDSRDLSILVRQTLEELVPLLRKSKELAALPLDPSATLQINSFDGNKQWPDPRSKSRNEHKIGKLRRKK